MESVTGYDSLDDVLVDLVATDFVVQVVGFPGSNLDVYAAGLGLVYLAEFDLHMIVCTPALWARIWLSILLISWSESLASVPTWSSASLTFLVVTLAGSSLTRAWLPI
ncbi:hypothetical protein AMATHDRAFT_5672 [Amanita thiersii Skay4041]|uniref:Uncharacterized protein n=1 Tax=Amanita thiersii Skay4041 TaxID=703135 RepID=A0A2A9NK06_9AGAR|nr:hypothetical protein AMATHDRAFT_5672 [Amanita thiersii Skay4041]